MDLSGARSSKREEAQGDKEGRFATLLCLNINLQTVYFIHSL